MKSKKIAIYTSVNPVGKSIVEEALRRGHIVTVIINDNHEFNLSNPNLTIRKGDVNKNEDLNRNIKDMDMVIYDQELKPDRPGECFKSIRSLMEGCKGSGINRLIISGHIHLFTSTLTMEEREIWKPVQEEQLDALGLLDNELDIDWSYFYTIETDLAKKSSRYITGTGNNFIVIIPNKGDRMTRKEYAQTVIDEAEKRIVNPDKKTTALVDYTGYLLKNNFGR